ncbi:MAG: hypothetical protein V4498_03305 [candidate division FCPU426 bacterium]
MAFKDYPGGREYEALWAPYALAKDTVERYPEGTQEPGCEVALIRYDEAAGLLEFHLRDLVLPSRCPRFASRACPRMEPMGHEPAQVTCNYWDYPRMQEFAPGIELYPEWQRFDCHKYYALFQAHLVGEELARQLGAESRFICSGPNPGSAKLLAVYAGFSSRPTAFEWRGD